MVSAAAAMATKPEGDGAGRGVNALCGSPLSDMTRFSAAADEYQQSKLVLWDTSVNGYSSCAIRCASLQTLALELGGQSCAELGRLGTIQNG
jgi:hypothetical protein